LAASVTVIQGRKPHSQLTRTEWDEDLIGEIIFRPPRREPPPSTRRPIIA
jgi:hypothetical protein